MAKGFWQRLFHRGGAMVILLLWLSGCGGGGGQVADGGIGGTGVVASGAITGTGSVIVNGVTYSTLGTRLEREGEAPLILDETNQDGLLQIGMVVRVDGTLDRDGLTGQAQRIFFEDFLEGPVESVVVDAAGVTSALVLGQTVVAEEGTPGLGDLIPGEVVEVSGLMRADGSILATFIRNTLPVQFEVLGRIAETPTADSFRIGGLTVDFTAADLRNLELAPGGELAAGLLVEVKGDTLTGQILDATEVEVRQPGLGILAGERAEIEGFVAERTATTFSLNGQLVDFTSAEFDQGRVTDLVQGVRVEAEGSIVEGVLIAEKIKFEDSINLEANLAAIDLINGEIQLAGLEPVTVRFGTDLTEFDSGLTPADLVVGDHLRIRGHEDGSGTGMRATRLRLIEAAPGSGDLVIQGPVRTFSSAAQLVDILGVTVDTANIAEGSFNLKGASGGRAAFYAALVPGTLVEARGILDAASGLPAWSEIGTED